MPYAHHLISRKLISKTKFNTNSVIDKFIVNVLISRPITIQLLLIKLTMILYAHSIPYHHFLEELHKNGFLYNSLINLYIKILKKISYEINMVTLSEYPI